MPGTLAEPLTLDTLLRAAEKSTGLDNWGEDQTFQIGLEQLVKAVEAMDPSPEFRANVHNSLVQTLGLRLHMVDDAVKNPEITRARIEKPLIIVGLPRTGTTILYDLLSLDPALRWPREWETFIPWPAPEAATMDTDPRIEVINSQYRAMLEKAPELETIQRFDATRPGECNHIFTHHFSSTNFSAEWSVPTYQEWYNRNRIPGHYATHKRVLQQLQWKGPRGDWLLKSPEHLFDLEGLLDTYPDAQLVWTHRDPALTLSSISSMIHALIKAQGLSVPKENVGAMMWNTWQVGMGRGTRSRNDDPRIENAILDLAHRDVVRDPVAAVRKIYDHFGREFSEEHARLIDDFIHNNPAASRIGKHKHSPEEYGLDVGEIREKLAGYYDRFGDFCKRPNEP
jgi:hypothetical protein